MSKDTGISEESNDSDEITDEIQLEDEEGTAGNYHWTDERTCTTPTLITFHGGDKRGAGSKIAIAEKDGKWYAAAYVSAEGGKGSSWGMEIPNFKSSYIPYDSRYAAFPSVSGEAGSSHFYGDIQIDEHLFVKFRVADHGIYIQTLVLCNI